MFIIRDIFQLKFGHYKDAKALLDQANQKKLMPEAKHMRILTDFTGDAYRLILEEGFDTLGDYEKNLQGGMKEAEWQKWYQEFKQHVDSSHREILRQIL